MKTTTGTWVALVATLAVAGTAAGGEIHDAAQKGDLARVKALLARDPALLEAEKEPNRKTPLHYAAQGGHPEVVELLLARGAQVNRPNIAGETPLHYAAALESPAVSSLLLSRGADVAARADGEMTPLRTAVAWERRAIVELLLDRGADARETTRGGETLLHLAAVVGPAETIDLLAVRGAAVNAVTSTGVTALLSACTAGNVATATALLRQGADPNRADAAGRQPLVLAVRTGQVEFVQRMLDAGAKVAGVAGGTSALHVAAAMGYGGIVDLLTSRGADRDGPDPRGRTPLDLATLHGHRRIAAALGGKDGTGAQAQPPSRPPLLATPPAMTSAVVWYLGQSGWVVRTRQHLLVFDAARDAALPDEPSLANGVLLPGEIGDVPLTVFISHDHADHYAPAVFDLGRSVGGVVSYVAGFSPEGKDGVVFMAPREKKNLGGVEVTTIASTDAGVGYLVRVDGLGIFHPGDTCNARGEASGDYKREIDFLADAGLTADLYFAPVGGCGEPAGVRNGVLYAIDRLGARNVFPMHQRGREHVYAEFAREAAAAGVRSSIYSAEYPGDRFDIPAPPASGGTRP